MSILSGVLGKFQIKREMWQEGPHIYNHLSHVSFDNLPQCCFLKFMLEVIRHVYFSSQLPEYALLFYPFLHEYPLYFFFSKSRLLKLSETKLLSDRIVNPNSQHNRIEIEIDLDLYPVYGQAGTLYYTMFP